MEQASRVKRTASHMLCVLAFCLGFVFPSWPNMDEDRNSAVKNLAKEIDRAQFHKVYVPDFLDPSGLRTEKGCYFASSFSTYLAKHAHHFEVVNRIQAQKQLDELHISPQDLHHPESLSKAAPALGADAGLVAIATISATDAKLFLSLRETATGKEAHSMDYHEQLKPTFDNSFPAGVGENSHIYYFPGLDGVSLPKCKHCPDPPYSEEMGKRKIEGAVLLSVRVDERGTITDVRLVKTPDHELATRAVDALKKWQMEPSHDLDGKPVPVRIAIEITIRLFH